MKVFLSCFEIYYISDIFFFLTYIFLWTRLNEFLFPSFWLKRMRKEQRRKTTLNNHGWPLSCFPGVPHWRSSPNENNQRTSHMNVTSEEPTTERGNKASESLTPPHVSHVLLIPSCLRDSDRHWNLLLSPHDGVYTSHRFPTTTAKPPHAPTHPPTEQERNQQ